MTKAAFLCGKVAFMKYLTTTILTLFLSSLFAQKIVGYLPYYRGINSSYDYTKYTHLHYFAIWPAADGTFIYPGAEDSLSMAADFAELKAKVASSDTKMIITFGGTAENGSEHFATMAKNETTRTNFINNVISLATNWEADGIDIDWEWGDPNSPTEDRQANGTLISELREACDNALLTLSVDVSPSEYNGKNYDATIMALADYINVMSYSYNGGWASSAGHHSPLSKIKSLGVNYWTGRGISKSKLNIGSAFYGFKYNGATQPGDVFTSINTLTYPQIENLINSGYTVVEDDENGTYCYSNSENAIAFYDSPQNINAKMNHVNADGLSGLIIWEIGQDNATQTLASSAETTTVETKQNLNPFQFDVFVNGDQLTLNSSVDNYSLKIFSIDGKLLLQKIISSPNEIINLPGNSPNLMVLQAQVNRSKATSVVTIK